MKNLGLIPARGGSRRLLGKNLADLGGKALIEWTIEAALLANYLDGVVVSTDEIGIANVARAAGAQVLVRPAGISGPDAKSIDVVRHAAKNIVADAYVLLQPTSPFRTAIDIDAAIGVMTRTDAEAVVSVTDAELPYVFELGHADRMREVRRLPGCCVPNGAIYILTRDALDAGLDWWTARAYAYRMPKSRSIDIDTAEDMEFAMGIAAAMAIEKREG